MELKAGTVAEYLAALKSSPKYGPQVVAHRTLAATASELLPPDLLQPELHHLLQTLGINALYAHQHRAITHILAGKHTVVATPTASGKSLIYTLPVFQTLCRQPTAKALFLFPLKALAQDQLKTIAQLWRLLPESIRGEQLPAAIYDGDTNSYQRKKIRERPPAILITNPDMLHLAMLPYHDRWGPFFADLRYIVIDEVHTYRGIFGSHVAWVMRRLKRICALYGSDPTFILASATIGNPGEHARLLIDAPVEEITRTGAATAQRHLVLLNPLDSAAASATQLLEAAIRRGLRTIVYCQSRKMTELITIWTEQRLKGQQGLIASYRSGFLPEERRAIEDRLATGSLLGVISTSALELGIDIGNLDLCLLVGYPGSMMATWQRAGRVGRKQQESLVVMIGHEDALDQYFMRHPEDFFSRPVEPVTINPDNPHIAGPQMVCAAAELPLTRADQLLHPESRTALLQRLTSSGQLLQSADGQTWFSPLTYPQRGINLRGSGVTLAIVTGQRRQLLGEIDSSRGLRDCHPGAIYLHRAQTYHVDSLDLEGREIIVSAVKPSYFTRVLSTKTTEILAEQDRVPWGAAEIFLGTLRVTEQINAFHRIAQGSQRIISRVPLDLPAQIFETEGMWIRIPDWLQIRIEAARLHFMGGIHALEHALIGMMPLFVLCDRNDLGGISHPWHDQTGGPAVFIYDGHAGGMGLTAKGFGAIGQLLEQTRRAVADCPCELGCPSCVHSPKCGSGNRPIDKAACLAILEQLRTGRPITALPAPPATGRTALPDEDSTPRFILPEKFGVFDIETRKSAEEVGGWHRADLMQVSVAVLYEHGEQRWTTFTEETIDQLIDRLFALDLVVGFNNKRFDNKVLSAYTDRDLGLLPAFDILEAVKTQLGYRLSLDRLAEKTLKVKKEGDGLMALRWFRQGEMEKLAAYCQKDVEITRELFLFGLRQHYLLFENKAGREVRLPVDFGRSITKIWSLRQQTLRARQDLYGSNRPDRDGRP